MDSVIIIAVIVALAVAGYYFIVCRYRKTIAALQFGLNRAQTNLETTQDELDSALSDLRMEREKMFAHLKVSKRGFATYSPQRKEILSNELFIQYINILSDKKCSYSEDVFDIPELGEIIDFLDDVQRRSEQKLETKSIQTDKNSKIFFISCIIFKDKSFEITIDDITQKEEQAQLKRQLTQNISHELKTPVASIQGYMETLLANPDIDKEKKDFYIKRCYTQAQRLTNLLQDISTINKLDEAPELYVGEELDLSVIIDNVFKDLALIIDEKKFTVIKNIPEKLMITGNATLLYSIFRNLMDNCLAYAGENITVNVNCYRSDNDFLYFSFSDNGTGVDEEHLDRLFDRFYRVDNGRSRKAGGTGLGLSIVKNAVLFHGGRITAKNHQGGGLEFLFTLKKN
ncbi:MAG: HAMP domain-containing histidine kinase [Paludibacteraceae bacterium]|nr:HAMP domain-containing histidine kinase [Paludibacteraceae bacterium]